MAKKLGVKRAAEEESQQELTKKSSLERSASFSQ
jgi:hypothetical protein